MVSHGGDDKLVTIDVAQMSERSLPRRPALGISPPATRLPPSRQILWQNAAFTMLAGLGVVSLRTNTTVVYQVGQSDSGSGDTNGEDKSPVVERILKDTNSALNIEQLDSTKLPKLIHKLTQNSPNTKGGSTTTGHKTLPPMQEFPSFLQRNFVPVPNRARPIQGDNQGRLLRCLANWDATAFLVGALCPNIKAVVVPPTTLRPGLEKTT